MISVLLDHPWPLEESLDRNSEGFDVLRKFGDLTRRHRLVIVPFTSPAELCQMWTRMDYRNTRTAGFAALKRIAGLLVRDTGGHCLARPIPEPSRLTDDWKCGLRDATIAEDWRSPQVVVPTPRRASWPAGHEVNIGFDVCDEIPASGPHQRVLASLDSYEAHPFALSDADPWDLRYIHQHRADISAHRRHNCCLPKPPCAEGVALEDLQVALENARAIGWTIGGKRYFIPPADWRPEKVEKSAWREGRAFPREMVPNVPTRNKMGYVDFQGIKWIWHPTELHWDVQTKPYLRLRCTGEAVV